MDRKSDTTMLVFGKWDTSGVQIKDPSLAKYVSLESKKIPHTFGKQTRKRFAKGKLSIVERLINKIMRSGQGKRKLSGKYIRGRGSCGKKLQAMHIVENAFEIIEKKTNKNPIQVLIDGIQFAGPREDITRIKRGGVSYSVSVDVAPLKKVDESLKNLALAAFSGSFNKKTSASEALAAELIAASNEDNASFSVKRRDEVERIAKASR
ncbi:MAG TPA: 30S ribosomal protein S7 [archaeon]|nr:30S ribosomal protein S7 [archaeon]